MSKKKMGAVQHDYKCDVCGKPAKYNIQDWWHKYEIDEDGELSEVDDWEGGTNEFFCEEHNN